MQVMSRARGLMDTNVLKVTALVKELEAQRDQLQNDIMAAQKREEVRHARRVVWHMHGYEPGLPRWEVGGGGNRFGLDVRGRCADLCEGVLGCRSCVWTRRRWRGRWRSCRPSRSS
jgi:hypothetical protein